MLDFISACGFESSVEQERNRYDAYVTEYAEKVITIRCSQSSEKSSGGWVAWVWNKTDSGKLESVCKMRGIVPLASDFPIVVRETKKYIDTRILKEV